MFNLKESDVWHIIAAWFMVLLFLGLCLIGLAIKIG